MRKVFLLVLLYWSAQSAVYAQDKTKMEGLYGIKNPDYSKNGECSECEQVLKNKPKEVSLGVRLESNRFIYFYCSDERVYRKIFTKGKDGIAIDIVRKDQYECGKENVLNGDWLYKGSLQEPVYYPEMKQKEVVRDGAVYIRLFALPPDLVEEELEFNFIILKNKYKCSYRSTFNLESSQWGLLEMGMYVDTLNEEMLNEKSNILGRKLVFEIPFEKDKAEFVAEDIRPLYDSLNLTEFDITSVKVRAYSSVEGLSDRNALLQQKRAESILTVLKKLNSAKSNLVKTEVMTSENWVELYEDIEDGRFSFLNAMNKEELKERFSKDKKLCEDMEPLFKKHRKAIVILELEPLEIMKGMDTIKIKAAFNKSIHNKNIKDALVIQREVFKRIRKNELPESFIKELEVPEQVDDGLLQNSAIAFKYQSNISNLFETLQEYTKLADIFPADNRIQYNLCVLQLKGWLSSQLIVDPGELKKKIDRLYIAEDMDRKIIERLEINYHIINADQMYLNKEYEKKDKSLNYIHQNYSYLHLSDADALSLSQYFVKYSNLKWAQVLLLNYVRKLKASEEVIFYYLNMTMSYQEYTSQKEYRIIMLNALNSNKKRFCSFFNTKGIDGGVSFQLLDDLYLKKTFCENCLK